MLRILYYMGGKMKKINTFFYIFLLAGFFISAQVLTVGSPRPGDEWTKGSRYTITWSSQGCPDLTVKINIFRNAIDQANFVEQLTGPNNGRMVWTIPQSYTTGNYILRVKTADNVCIGDSGLFSILAPDVPAGGIRIIQPTSMWSYNAGGNMTVKWTCAGQSFPVSIVLRSADNSYELAVKESHPCSGSPLTWKIPDSLATGKYHVEISQHLPGNLSASSGNFTINAKTSVINVLEPAAGVTRLNGQTCQITWHSSNLESDKVLIRLNPKSGPLAQELCIVNGNAANKEGRNSHTWTIPAQIPDGKYSISVEKHDGSVKGESGHFGIGGTRGCDLAIDSAEFCSGKLNVTIKNNGDHYTGKITVMLIYDMPGRGRISIPVIVKDNFLLFSGKNLTLTERNSAVYACSMNYSLLLIPDKDHTDKIGANNQYNGVAYKDCNVRECNKPDLWFSRVWIKKKYHNSVVHTGKNQKIFAELVKTGNISGTFTTRVIIYYHKLQFDPWTKITENRWRLGDFNNQKELSFTFKPQNAGYYVFEWVTDIHDEIKERDESNNKMSGGENIRD